MNLAELPERENERFGEHVTVIFRDRRWTNFDMRSASRRLAGALKDLGVKKDDRVIIQMPNCPQVLQSFLAVYMIGAVVVPINFMVGEPETAYIYRDTGTKVIISSTDFLSKIEACRSNAPEIKHVILADQEVPAGYFSYQQLIEEQSGDISMDPTDDNDLSALIYTAGTTGWPRGVMHTHYSLYSNAKMQQDTLNFAPGMTSISVLPLCHYYDEDGYFFITERKKDLIIKAGENIAPREVEEVICSHPAVSESAVVGMEDEVYGEDIKAFVVLLPGRSTTEEEIIEHCRASLKSFKSPKQVVFMESLPKSLVGKILRKELRKKS